LDISVDTYNGVVTLFGIVPTPAAREAALVDARKVDATVKINDELQVVPEGMKQKLTARDDEIKSEIEKKLKGNSDCKNVKVDVKSGIVHLTGKVASGWARLSAA